MSAKDRSLTRRLPTTMGRKQTVRFRTELVKNRLSAFDPLRTFKASLQVRLASSG